MGAYNVLFELINDMSYNDGSVDFMNDIDAGVECLVEYTDNILKDVIPHITDSEVREKMKYYLEKQVPKKIIELDQFTTEWYTLIHMLLKYMGQNRISTEETKI